MKKGDKILCTKFVKNGNGNMIACIKAGTIWEIYQIYNFQNGLTAYLRCAKTRKTVPLKNIEDLFYNFKKANEKRK